jgi:hypothetical protein
MGAASAAREAKRKDGEVVSYLMGATKIYKGTMVFLRIADGYAYAGRAGTSTDIFVGIADETVDNSAGSAGSARIRVLKSGTYEFALGSIAQTDLGLPVYALYDNEVTKTATYNVLVGYVQEMVDSATARVRIDAAVR